MPLTWSYICLLHDHTYASYMITHMPLTWSYICLLHDHTYASYMPHMVVLIDPSNYFNYNVSDHPLIDVTWNSKATHSWFSCSCPTHWPFEQSPFELILWMWKGKQWLPAFNSASSFTFECISFKSSSWFSPPARQYHMLLTTFPYIYI